ncbi:hypothetical protein CL622_07250 [archaeon]|nr:hypothetical protein [archaeon]|tara:strand:+ start:675 stop:1055 length:381 start_codon:yes stop_codon:yes gene_type:complete
MKINVCTLTEPVTCQENQAIIEVAKILKEKRIRHVVVLNKKYPVGMLASVDIVNRVVAENKDPKKILAKDVMTTPLEVIDEQEELQKAYIAMMKKNTFSCPIVNKKNEFIGMLPFVEVIKHLELKD